MGLKVSLYIYSSKTPRLEDLGVLYKNRKNLTREKQA